MKKSNIMSASALFLGIILAVATSAFKPALQNEQGFTVYTFAYNGPVAYTPAQVADVNNWTYVSSGTLCDNTPDKACRIQATDSYVDASGTPVLQSTINISTGTGITGKAYVSAIGDSMGAISNSTD
jgi:hypothetical protein